MTAILIVIAVGYTLKILHERLKDALQIANAIMEIEEDSWH